MNVGFFENIYRAISLSRKTHPLSAVGKIILENFLRLKAFSFLIPAPILPLLKSSKFRDWISFISPNTKPSYSIPKEKKKKTILFFLLMIFNVDQLLKSLLNLLQYCFWVLFFFLSVSWLFESQGMWELSSSSRNQTCTRVQWKAKFQPLDCQRSPKTKHEAHEIYPRAIMESPDIKMRPESVSLTDCNRNF